MTEGMNSGKLQSAIVRMLAMPQDQVHTQSITFQTIWYPWAQYWSYETLLAYPIPK